MPYKPVYLPEKASSRLLENALNPRIASMEHESTKPNTSGDLCRRNFLRLLSLGTVGLGFGVSIFSRGYAMAEEADKETAHQLLMQGTRDFKGVRISEITPNDMFYKTTYDGTADLSLDTWQLSIEGLVDKPIDPQAGRPDEVDG